MPDTLIGDILFLITRKAFPKDTKEKIITSFLQKLGMQKTKNTLKN